MSPDHRRALKAFTLLNLLAGLIVGEAWLTWHFLAEAHLETALAAAHRAGFSLDPRDLAGPPIPDAENAAPAFEAAARGLARSEWQSLMTFLHPLRVTLVSGLDPAGAARIRGRLAPDEPVLARLFGEWNGRACRFDPPSIGRAMSDGARDSPPDPLEQLFVLLLFKAKLASSDGQEAEATRCFAAAVSLAIGLTRRPRIAPCVWADLLLVAADGCIPPHPTAACLRSWNRVLPPTRWSREIADLATAAGLVQSLQLLTKPTDQIAATLADERLKYGLGLLPRMHARLLGPMWQEWAAYSICWHVAAKEHAGPSGFPVAPYAHPRYFWGLAELRGLGAGRLLAARTHLRLECIRVGINYELHRLESGRYPSSIAVPGDAADPVTWTIDPRSGDLALLSRSGAGAFWKARRPR
ncbi:MAG: hypothetical protein HZA54_11895 [Planctomycetes bacterium]|nr:hypothetical protein [Planctomycetota bacterium]